MTNDVVGLCRDLIRFDTSNHGDGSGPGERLAAEYVAERLDAAGLTPEIIEPAPRRTSVVARVEGRDSARPALLLHGHLDVVPARAEEWSVDPFAGEIRDGCLWGRGAVDMKNMNAMILSALAAMAAEGRRPSRDVVVAFLADEEAGGRHGSFWLAEHRRELFEDCTEAVSEVGGFSVTVGTGSRLYLIETARKGVLWLRLRARGAAGHASLTNRDNPVTRLAGAVARLGAHEWPLRPTPTTRRTAETIAAATGADPAADDLTGTSIELIGPLLTSSMRHVANPTMLAGADAINIVPAMAEARVDGRFVAGGEEDFLRQVAEIVGPEIEIEVLDRTPAGESGFGADVVARMAAALAAEDDGARVVPYCTSASTDNAAFATLGIQGFGFVPLRLPAGFDFAAMFHGRDERVPLESLCFGARVLDRFLTDC